MTILLSIISRWYPLRDGSLVGLTIVIDSLLLTAFIVWWGNHG